jgi:S-DNA-T family DNA segregation ATPase FtsK/SpoIIIE
MADMMMSSASNRKEAERCINRIAAKARAVWIHLILATQRPEVNVITWLIKANIPARIAFSVVSDFDSRTILWHRWAEELVWRWDMLYMDAKITDLRIQWAFVDTKEIDAVVESLKRKYMVWLTENDVYNQEIIDALESKSEIWWSFSWWGSGNWDDEDLINQAMQIIAETRKASTTMIQRKLWIWFARAARIMDTLEERWIVWPQDWARWRDIFI